MTLSGTGTQIGIVSSIAIQPNNQILLGGTFGTDLYPEVARINVDGSLNTTFGSSGFALTGSTTGAFAEVAAQPDGSVLAAGFAGSATEVGFSTNVPLLARLFAGDVSGAAVNAIDPSPALPLTLSGDATTTAGTAYTITLGGGSDLPSPSGGGAGGGGLGSGSEVGYVIHWGDGTPNTTVSADALAAQQDTVTHVFNTGTSGISVDLVVNDVTYSAVGYQAVIVNMTGAGLLLQRQSGVFGLSCDAKFRRFRGQFCKNSNHFLLSADMDLCILIQDETRTPYNTKVYSW